MTIINSRRIYIHITHTPSLGLVIAVCVRERKQGRFIESTEGVRRSSEGARKEYERRAAESTKKARRKTFVLTFRTRRGSV